MDEAEHIIHIMGDVVQSLQDIVFDLDRRVALLEASEQHDSVASAVKMKLTADGEVTKAADAQDM